MPSLSFNARLVLYVLAVVVAMKILMMNINHDGDNIDSE